jgi:hypothetical protein
MRPFVTALIFLAHVALPSGIQDAQDSDLVATAKTYEAARYKGESTARWLSDNFLRISWDGGIDSKPLEERAGPGYQDIGLRDMRDRTVRIYANAIAVIAGQTGNEGTGLGPVRRLFVWQREPAGWKLLSEHTTWIGNATDWWSRSRGDVPEPKPIDPMPPDQQWFVDAENRLAGADSAAAFSTAIADDAIIVDDRGRVQSVASWIDTQLSTSTPRFRLTMASVLVVGDAARVMGQLRDISWSARAFRFTHLWIRRDGVWQIVVSQVSPSAIW